MRFFPATEVEPERERGFEGGDGKKAMFRARSQKVTIMLEASPDAPSTPMPHLIRINARPILDGQMGAPLAVGEIPMLVVKPNPAP